MALTWTITTYMNYAARECSIAPPSAWLSSTSSNELLLRAFLDDTIRDLIRRHDWNQLTDDQTVTGTGATAYALATDFLRLARGDNAVYENSPSQRPCTAIHRNGDWTELIERNWAGAQRFYRLAGSNIEFFQALPAAAEVTVAYVSKNWRVDSGGNNPLDTWTAEADLSLLPGHLLQLGVIWRFRRHKGLQYLDRKVEFEAELARAIADDRPIGSVTTDATRETPRSPFDIPVPDFIPAS